MQAMVNVCSTNMWLKPAIAAIELAQMVVQGVWNEDSRLLQLPHFDKERSRGFEAEGVDNIFDFTEMEDATRSRLLEGLSERAVADVVEFCNEYPDIEVTAQLEATTVKTGSEGVLHVSLSAGEDGFDTAVRSQQFPQKLRQTWWLILGDPKENTIQSIVEVDLDRASAKDLVFTTPSQPGHYKWMLYFMTDSYVGCDQEQEVEFDVEGDMREWGVCCPKQCTIAKAVSPEGGACRLFQKNTSKRIEAPAGVSSKMTNLFHFHIKSTRIMSTELPKISTGLPPEDTLNDEERLRIRKNCRNLMSYPNTCSHECRYPSSESGDCSSPC